jgi:hypothetical protein
LIAFLGFGLCLVLVGMASLFGFIITVNLLIFICLVEEPLDYCIKITPIWVFLFDIIEEVDKFGELII